MKKEVGLGLMQTSPLLCSACPPLGCGFRGISVFGVLEKMDVINKQPAKQ